MESKAQEKNNWVDLNALTTRSKLVLLAMGFIVLLFFWYGLQAWWQKSKLRHEKNTHQTLMQSKAFKQKRVMALRKTAAQTAALQVTFNQLLKGLPPESDIEDVLDDITNIGAKQKLKFIYFRPQSEENRDFYAVMPIKMALFGDYHNLAEFISDMANLNHLVTAGNFTLIRQDEAGGLLRMNIIANVYSRKPGLPN